ncbi:hypothetical protein RUND412_007172 [Rhizina undulata]
MSRTISSLKTVYTELPPSCVLFAPEDKNVVVVGTYLLDESQEGLGERKRGEVVVYEKRPGNNELTLLQKIPTKAVLDIKFSPHDQSLFAVAQSFGTISFFRLRERELVLESEERFLDPEVLVLSLAFSPTDPELMAYTLSTGGVGLFHLGRKEVVYSYDPHTLEAWTCEFSPDGRILYSGGDDSVLVALDLESKGDLWRDRKTHMAGVTAILCYGDGRLLTGSYDEFLRVFDIASGRGRLVEDIRLGGGVWRLMWRDDGSLLASCMHAGARIVGVKEEKLEMLASFKEHESMNYGSHVHAGDKGTVLSCSFYDKRLCLWSVN